jgi:predicted RNA-binding protein associated with RNAse of E/G family
MMSTITVRKLDPAGQEKWRYQGETLLEEPGRIVLQAYFDRDDYPVHEIVLRRGDRFVETYYADRWYNRYKIFDGAQGQLKAIYYNIGYPAEIRNATVSYRDLALDVIAYPDGRVFVLDEDEFEDLPLSPQIRAQARHTLEELRRQLERDIEWDADGSDAPPSHLHPRSGEKKAR